MSDIAIRVENLSKQYRIGAARERHDMLRDALVALLRRNGKSHKANTIWALKDVSFEIKAGEVVGVIGRNGAGKSTLLKILSRITEPTSGRAEIHGRVGSLLEVGTGFHPELTGRENIYLNGAILGMKRTEIAAKFDEIVAFAEIEKFLETPVKRYSSGMYVRLAFAVAAHLEPEILLVDEVLAVGDMAFQKKCLGKMGDVAHQGKTVLFVSHHMAAIENLCQRGLLFERGAIRLATDIRSLLTAYSDSLNQRADRITGSIAEEPRTGTTLLSLTAVDEQGNETVARSGGDVRIEMQVEVLQPVRHAICTIGLNDSYGNRVTVLHSEIAGHDIELQVGCNRVLCYMPAFPLVPGSYRMDVHLLANHESLLWASDLGPLEVTPGDFYETGRLPDPKWSGRCYVAQTWSKRSA